MTEFKEGGGMIALGLQIFRPRWDAPMTLAGQWFLACVHGEARPETANKGVC